MPKNKKDYQICPSITWALLNQNKNKYALKPYKNEMAWMETPNVPLKLHYGSRLSLKSLQKWRENRYRSRVTVKPPKSIGMSTMEKTIHASYEDTGRKVSNNTIKTQVTSSKNYVMCYGGWEALEKHDEQAISIR